MTNKPEWFEIADGDKPEVKDTVEKKSFLRPLVALVIAGTVIGGGAVLAQTNEEPPANAETLNSSDPGAQLNGSSSSTTTQNGALGNAPQNGGATSQGGIQNPMTNPQQGGREFGDGDREHHDGFGDGDHRERFGDGDHRRPGQNPPPPEGDDD